MPQYVAIDDRVEVNSQSISVILEGMSGFQSHALRVLEENGIPHLAPGQWIPLTKWLSAFRAIGETIGQSTLLSIGKRVPDTSDFPSDIDSIQAALASINIAYHMNHRIGEQLLFVPETGELLEGIGQYLYEATGFRSATMVCENPYPCRFDEGLIQAIADRFKPKNSLYVEVEHDDGRPCRNLGGESCTYHIKW